MEQDQALKIL